MREPEPETIRLAQSGDLSAFESLVRDYQGDVWRFAYHLTRNRATADDVTQEAFLRSFRAIRSFSGTAKFTSWLLRIVRNCSIDMYRRTRLEEPADVESTMALRTTPGVDAHAAAEDRARISDALRGLAPELREPFVVIEVLGFNYAEASVILDVKVGTVKSRMHRARQELIRALRESEAADEM